MRSKSASASCGSNPPAPVIDRQPVNKPAASTPAPSTSTGKTTTKPATNRPTYKTGDWRPSTYTVKKGDTLFSIGLEFGYDYKELAQANNIAPPYNIRVGQTLTLAGTSEAVKTYSRRARSHKWTCSRRPWLGEHGLHGSGCMTL